MSAQGTASEEEQSVLRSLVSGPFAPTEVTAVWIKLCNSGRIRRNGVGRQGRVLFSITPSGLSLLNRCSPQK